MSHNAFDCFSLVQPKIDDSAHVLRQNIAGRTAALNHGGSNRRCNKRKGIFSLHAAGGNGIAVTGYILDQRMQRLLGNIRGECLKSGSKRFRQAGRKGLAGDGCNSTGEMLKRTSSPRAAGMAAFAFYSELEIGIPLFHEIDHRNTDSGSSKGSTVFYFTASLIQNKFQTYPTAPERFSNCKRAFIQRLFIISKGKVGGSTKPMSVTEKILDCFQNAENHIFDIESSAAPDVPVGNSPGKSIVSPVLLRAANDRDDILVGHIETGEKGGIRAGNCNQYCMAD